MSGLQSATLARVGDREGEVELTAAIPVGLDPETMSWLGGLRAEGEQRLRAVERLHDLLLRAARREAYRRRNLTPVGGVELDDLCQQAADDAVVAVLAKLDNYRGASRFTTWAYKFAVFEVLTKLRRHAWRRGAILAAEDDPVWLRLGDQAGDANGLAEGLELVRALRQAVEEELTPRQRQVFVAVVLNEVPGDVLAQQLGTSRGAIYKTVHDARRKLRRRLEAGGYIEPVGEAWTSRS